MPFQVLHDRLCTALRGTTLDEHIEHKEDAAGGKAHIRGYRITV